MFLTLCHVVRELTQLSLELSMPKPVWFARRLVKALQRPSVARRRQLPVAPISSARSKEEAAQADEAFHRKVERYYWAISAVVSVVATAGAIVAAVYAALAFAEARRQAIAAVRQADAAANPFIVASFKGATSLSAAVLSHEPNFQLVLSLANYGQGPAIIEEIRCGAYLGEHEPGTIRADYLPTNPPVENEYQRTAFAPLSSYIVAPGGKEAGDFSCPVTTFVNAYRFSQYQQLKGTAYQLFMRSVGIYTVAYFTYRTAEDSTLKEQSICFQFTPITQSDQKAFFIMNPDCSKPEVIQGAKSSDYSAR
jgi:hypothetical protein